MNELLCIIRVHQRIESNQYANSIHGMNERSRHAKILDFWTRFIIAPAPRCTCLSSRPSLTAPTPRSPRHRLPISFAFRTFSISTTLRYCTPPPHRVLDVLDTSSKCTGARGSLDALEVVNIDDFFYITLFPYLAVMHLIVLSNCRTWWMDGWLETSKESIG